MSSRDEHIAYWLASEGARLEPAILNILRDSHISGLCYAFKLRTKQKSRLLDKQDLKQKDKPAYKLTDITDVVGLRLVALFKSDMVGILDGVLSAMLHTNGISPNPFIKKKPQEIIIYKGHAAFDDLIPELKDVVTKHCGDADVKEKNSREGYSSIHLVTHLELPADRASDSPIGGDYFFPIEIQIRTVFEDAWGEIDHKYGYVLSKYRVYLVLE